MTEEKDYEIVTQEDVANYVGVSRAVVSYVVNNNAHRVSEETRNRVLNAIEKLGYKPNKHAQRLRMGNDAARNSIGIIVGGTGYQVLERSYYSTMLARLFDNAHELNVHIRFFSFFDAFKDPIFFNKNVHPAEISALLIMMPRLIQNDPEIKPILTQIMERIDTILCLEASIFDLPAMEIDLSAAAHMATEHLIELGHRRIALLAFEDDERYSGYKQTLKKHDIPIDDSIIHLVDSTRLYQSSYELTGELLDARPAISAIFCANDEMGIGAITRIQDGGLRIPDDISIVSIDDTSMATMIRPSLTTVRLPFEHIGTHALEHLLSLKNQSNQHPATVSLPIQLIVRQSTGAVNIRG